MSFLELPDTRLYYEDTGPGSTGETIAFSHGLLWGTELFAPQIAALRGRYRCIAWDHRGQGRSAADHRDTIGMELVWQDAVQLLEALGTGPVHFCGLSMGGFVAMRMAARRPDLVRSLILLETSSDPEPIENVARYRLLTRVTRLVGPRLIKNKVAPIMLGRTLLADKSRRAELARFVDLMSRRRDIWRAVGGVVDGQVLLWVDETTATGELQEASPLDRIVIGKQVRALREVSALDTVKLTGGVLSFRVVHGGKPLQCRAAPGTSSATCR